jgi:hypothetical protein
MRPPRHRCLDAPGQPSQPPPTPGPRRQDRAAPSGHLPERPAPLMMAATYPLAVPLRAAATRPGSPDAGNFSRSNHVKRS